MTIGRKRTRRSSIKSNALSTIYALIVLFSILVFGCQSIYYDKSKRLFHKSLTTYKIGALGSQWKNFSIDQCDLAFHHKQNSSAILINSTCRQDYEDVALSTLTQHVFYGFEQRRKRTQRTIQISQRQALYTDFDASLDGVKVRAVVIVLKKNQCIYDFVYAARPHDFSSAGINTLQQLITGFQVIRD